MINAARIILSQPIHHCLMAHDSEVTTTALAMVSVQADEIITIVDGLCRSRLAAAQGCFKHSIRRQRRNKPD
jgi:hypothetical protein